MSTSWKKLENSEIKHSSAHHLMAVHQLKNEIGYARTTDISKQLNITRGSVSITLNRLKENGYITFDKNKHISLTQKGQHFVEDVLRKRATVKQFFQNALFMKEEQATKCACKLEHVITDDVIDRLEKFSNYMVENLADHKEKIKAQLTSKQNVK